MREFRVLIPNARWVAYLVQQKTDTILIVA
jgi:hypothetical protein